MDKNSYLSIPEQVSELVKIEPSTPFVMPNMVKYEALLPVTGMTAKESYKEYMKQATPFFLKANAEIVFYGSSKHMFIGPKEDIIWNDVLIVKSNSVSDLMPMIMGEVYPSNLREQALNDSRLIQCAPNQKKKLTKN